MKKIVSALFLFLVINSFGQNTFPNNGNVGINTSNPSARLDVNGNMKVDSSLIVKDSVTVEKDMRTKGKITVEDKAFFVKLVTMYEKLNVYGNIVGENNIKAINNLIAEHNVNVGNNVNVTNNVNIDNNLNVTGTAKFDSNVKLMNVLGLSNLNNPDLEIILRTPNGNLRTFSVLDLIGVIEAEMEPAELATCLPGYADDPYWISAVNKLYTVCDEVRVGIGIVNPQFKLDVDGTTHSIRFHAGSYNNSNNALYSGYTTQGNVSNLLDLGNMTSNSSQETRFLVKNNGNVEIHCSSGYPLVAYNPAGIKILQLQDDGLLRAREIKVDLNSWPDYVFDEGYELMSINDLAEFIQIERHLPGLPNAKELESRGLNLGEMVKIQMEKIEEQALYTIQLSNQINELKDENEELRAEIESLRADIVEIKESLNK